jgi:DNA-binding transcriptional regulator GbsR (MarR family)
MEEENKIEEIKKPLYKMHATTHNLSRIMTVLETSDFPMTKTAIARASCMVSTNVNDGLQWLVSYGFVKKIYESGKAKEVYVIGDRTKLGISTFDVIIDNERKLKIKIRPVMTKDEFIELFSQIIDKLKLGEKNVTGN